METNVKIGNDLSDGQKNSSDNDNNDTNEDHEDMNENNEENEENGQNSDIFSLLYGTEEDREENDSEEEAIEEEDDSCQQNNESIPDIRLDSMEANVNRNEDLNQKSTKRRSVEDDGNQSKRIKAEPLDKPMKTSTDLITTTCERVEEELEIPKNSMEFMDYLLSLDGRDLEPKDKNQCLKRLLMSEKLVNISQELTFKDSESLRNVFIPYIISDLWLKMNVEYSDHQKRAFKVKHFCSIITKQKSIKMTNGLDMRCISILKPETEPLFRFGQIVIFQTAVPPKPDCDSHIITEKKYLGYVTTHTIRESNPQNQSEVNHLRALIKDKKDSVLIEEICLTTQFYEELYLRNDAIIIAQPLLCIHHHLMEARSVFKSDQFPVFRQILNPIYSSRPAGVSMNINEKKFNDIEKESIQIGLDVVANTSAANSSFMVINGSKTSSKTTILVEIIKQIVGFEGFKDSKVLFTSSDDNTLKNMYQLLRRHRIKAYFLENKVNTHLKESTINYLKTKLSKDEDNSNKEIFESILQSLESDEVMKLSAEGVLKRNGIYESLKTSSLIASPVIVGRIDDLCNDIPFYKNFSSRSQFNCCIIDDAIGTTELQMYSLFGFGITKFIFGVDFNEELKHHQNSDETDILSAFCLSRSFAERYHSLCEENDIRDQSTIINV